MLISAILVLLFVLICTDWLSEPLLTADTTLISGEVIDSSANASGEIKCYISLSSTENDVVTVIPISGDTEFYSNTGLRLFSADYYEVLQLNTKVKALVSSDVIYDDYESLSGEYVQRNIHEFCYSLTVLD